MKQLLEEESKTPMQQLFEEMKEKGFFIAEYIKRPALEREAQYVSKKYQEGYEQGKEDKVTEMFGNRDEFYEKELKRYNTGLREWPIKRDYPTIPENKNQE